VAAEVGAGAAEVAAEVVAGLDVVVGAAVGAAVVATAVVGLGAVVVVDGVELQPLKTNPLISTSARATNKMRFNKIPPNYIYPTIANILESLLHDGEIVVRFKANQFLDEINYLTNVTNTIS
jgi:hypothetical protein